MRCPECGALNSESAEWCTQCYQRLGAASPPPAPPEPPAPAEAPADATADTPPDVGETVPVQPRSDRFRRTGQEFEWRCAVCDNWNPLADTRCRVCGADLVHAATPPTEAPPTREVSPALAITANAVLPGTGHAVLGQTVWGGVLAGTYLLWLIAGLALLREAAAAGQPPLPAVPPLLGAAALWLASVHDAVALTSERPRDPVLTARLYLWLVVAVLGALMLAVVPNVFRVVGR